MSGTFFTPKQVARAIGVSESSLKRWCDQGRLGNLRTAGGHRRLTMTEVVNFLRESGQTLACPEALGLPSACGHGQQVLDRARAQFLEGALAGDAETCRRIVINLFLANRSACEISDEVLAPILYECGRLRQCGQAEVYQERRAGVILEQVLHELRTLVGPAPASSYRAVGASPGGDPNRIPSIMVELTLRELGWAADNLGSDVPLPSLQAAMEHFRPRLFWLSVSSIDDADAFLAQYGDFFRAARRCGAAVAVSGSALIEPIRQRMEYTVYCDNLRHLSSFVSSLFPAPRSTAATPSGSSDLPPAVVDV